MVKLTRRFSGDLCGNSVLELESNWVQCKTQQKQTLEPANLPNLKMQTFGNLEC